MFRFNLFYALLTVYSLYLVVHDAENYCTVGICVHTIILYYINIIMIIYRYPVRLYVLRTGSDAEGFSTYLDTANPAKW